MESPSHGVCSDVERSLEYGFGRITAFLCRSDERNRKCRCGHQCPYQPGSPAALRWVYGMEDSFAAMREAKKECA